MSAVEKVQFLKSKVGSIKLISADTGPASNPVMAYLMIEADEQYGDALIYDVYSLPGVYTDALAAYVKGDYVNVTGPHQAVEDSIDVDKIVNQTVTVQISKDGKRLKAPVIVPTKFN
jgi:hypothetical protein